MTECLSLPLFKLATSSSIISCLWPPTSDFYFVFLIFLVSEVHKLNRISAISSSFYSTHQRSKHHQVCSQASVLLQNVLSFNITADAKSTGFNRCLPMWQKQGMLSITTAHSFTEKLPCGPLCQCLYQRLQTQYDTSQPHYQCSQCTVSSLQQICTSQSV